MRKKLFIALLGCSSLLTLASCSYFQPSIPEPIAPIVNEKTTLTLSGKKTMDPGDSQYLSTSVSDANDSEVVYSSSDKNVATVDSTTGLVKAIKKGTVTITASLSTGQKASFDITVTDITTLKFNVSFKNEDGSLLYQEEVPYEGKANFVGPDPVKSADYHYAYDFVGWDFDVTKPITKDTVFTAQYEERDISNYLFTSVTTGEGGYMFYSFTGEEANVIDIPSLYNNQPVTVLDSNAFSGKKIRKIVLPNSLGVLKSGAFASVSGLEEIEVPDSIYDFGTNVFSGCTSLITVNLPSTLTNVPEGTFKGCSSLKP